MDFSLLAVVPQIHDLSALFRDWRGDAMEFVRTSVPKLILIIIAAFVLIRVVRIMTRRMSSFQEKKLPSGLRSQQIRTLAGVLNSVGVFVIVFVAALMGLEQLNLHLEPLLASAGIAGLAIGFGAQTMVHDFINGFFILFENQYDLGDTVRIAGVKGAVEDMSLRRTMLRDDDGTVHIVPNSEIKIVSNLTRDWSQLTLRVVVAYSEPSDKIVILLQQVGAEIRHDPSFAEDIVSDVQVPGIDRVGNGEAEYLMLVKTLPNKQFGVSRELRRRIKDCFQKNNIQTAGPGKVYVMDQGEVKAS
ncbi:MAG: mechanosensitive ion channel family protein [Terriglobales bacterium]